MTRTWRGTAGNDTVTGRLNDDNLFTNFGQGFDNLTGGNRLRHLRPHGRRSPGPH